MAASQPDEPQPRLSADPTALTGRGLRTRQRLTKAARRVFERDGFVAARITDIAKEAKVAHGTFYTYFDSKEACFREVIVELEASMLGHQEPPADAPRDPWDAIETSNRRYLEVYRDNAALMLIWEQVASFNPEFNELLHEGKLPFAKRAEKAIRTLQKEGIADPDIDAHYASHALTGMVSRFAHSWFGQGEDFEFERAVNQVTRLWANAIGLKKPAKRRR